MLTVLKNNLPALEFYANKMKYDVDMTSPSLSDDYPGGGQNAGHEILSKIVDKAGVAAIEKLVAEGV